MATHSVYSAHFSTTSSLQKRHFRWDFPRGCERGTTSDLALLYSLLYFFDLDLTEPFDFEESLARSSMNRLAWPNYQLHFIGLAPARNEQEQYSDSKVAVRFKLGYVCGSNAYDLSTVWLPRTED